jgi:hypothetical protein
MKYQWRRLATMGSAFVGIIGPGAYADTIITDFNFYPNNTVTGSFSTQADFVGETFTTPADNVLTNFTFELDGSNGPIELSIYNWDEADGKLTGNSLFTSVPTSSPNNVFGFSDDTYSFSIPGLALTTNGSYVAVLQGTNGFVGPMAIGGTLPTLMPGDPYPGGEYVVGNSLNDLTGIDLDIPGLVLHFDLVFSAHFSSAVPEPGAYVLLASLGCSGAGFLLRRRKRVG